MFIEFVYVGQRRLKKFLAIKTATQSGTIAADALLEALNEIEAAKTY